MVHMCLATESQQINLALHSVLRNELLKETKLLKFKTMLRLAYFKSEWNAYYKDALDSALLGLPTRKHYQLVYCLLTSLSKITLRQWQNMTLYLLFSTSGFGYPQNFRLQELASPASVPCWKIPFFLNWNVMRSCLLFTLLNINCQRQGLISKQASHFSRFTSSAVMWQADECHAGSVAPWRKRSW